MTISQIKAQATKAPYYFDRKTLKFFGQTMSSFKVVTSKSGKVFIYAPMTDHRGVKMGFSIAEFKNKDLLPVTTPRTATTATEIKNYLKSK
jgi:hypothetical protein